jgi:hypothetical protein
MGAGDEQRGRSGSTGEDGYRDRYDSVAMAVV